MHDEARSVVDQGRLGAPVTETRIAFMRYVGQGHEILVPLPTRTLTAEDVPEIHAAYEREYAKYFDRPVPGSDVEVMSYAVILMTKTPEIAATPGNSEPVDAKSGRSQLVRDTLTGAVSSWDVHDRTEMSAGSRVRGPAIIAEDETSTLVGPGWRGFINGLGYIEIVRGDA
jgi:N-methylhydantoinase A